MATEDDQQLFNGVRIPVSTSPSPTRSSIHTYQPNDVPVLQLDTQRLYLHHFIQSTASIYFPLQTNDFLRLVLATGESSPCMLGALLVASCSHLARLKRDDDNSGQLAAAKAMAQTLSSLRRAISCCSPTASGTLATSLMLATTCLCSGDMATYRQHLEGARRFAQQFRDSLMTDELWGFGIKWLAHLLLMEQVSSSPSASSRRSCQIDRGQLAGIMQDFCGIDPSNGLSFDLITTINEICDISQLSMGKQSELRAWNLEQQLFEQYSHASHSLHGGSQSVLVHSLYTGAALLTLYTRAMGLQSDEPRVVTLVASMRSTLDHIDVTCTTNIPLLWPLLAAGCEATSDMQREEFAQRISAMAVHGVGNCHMVLDFMRKYW